MTTSSGPITPRFINPAGMVAPVGYTQVVTVDGPHRTVYISGQLGITADGKLAGEAGDFRAQTQQAFQNIQLALAAAGASFEQVVKLGIYALDLQKNLSVLREARAGFLHPTQPPAITAVEVPNLAVAGSLIEIEAIAVVPALSR